MIDGVPVEIQTLKTRLYEDETINTLLRQGWRIHYCKMEVSSHEIGWILYRYLRYLNPVGAQK